MSAKFPRGGSRVFFGRQSTMGTTPGERVLLPGKVIVDSDDNLMICGIASDNVMITTNSGEKH